MVKLWSQDTEKDFFNKSLKLTTKEQLFYRMDSGKLVAYWPKNYKDKKSTLQSRNAFIGNFTEKKKIFSSLKRNKKYNARQIKDL